MYIIPQEYKCNKCQHEFKYGPHNEWNTPVIEEEEIRPNGADILTHSLPVCPKCWKDFIRQNLGLGYSTADWGYGGSHYDRVVKRLI